MGSKPTHANTQSDDLLFPTAKTMCITGYRSCENNQRPPPWERRRPRLPASRATLIMCTTTRWARSMR